MTAVRGVGPRNACDAGSSRPSYASTSVSRTATSRTADARAHDRAEQRGRDVHRRAASRRARPPRHAHRPGWPTRPRCLRVHHVDQSADCSATRSGDVPPIDERALQRPRHR